MSENVWEAQARARKVDKLTDWVFAQMLKMRDMDAITAADAGVRFCDNAEATSWEVAAREAGVKPPSSVTVEMVRGRLVAMRDAMAKAPDDLFVGMP